MVAELAAAVTLKPAWLLVLEKLRQFGVVYRAIAVLVVNVKEAVDLRRGCAGGFTVLGFSCRLLGRIGSRCRVSARSARRAKVLCAQRREAGKNHCARRLVCCARRYHADAGTHHAPRS